jgi:hypothetical protein
MLAADCIEAAAQLLRLLHTEIAGEQFTAGEILSYVCDGNLEFESAAIDCVYGRTRVNRSKKRRAGVRLNAESLGLYLRTLTGQRFGTLELSASYNSHSGSWRYSVEEYTPIKLDLKPEQFEVVAGVRALKRLGKDIERAEEERREAAANFVKLQARMAQEATIPRDWRGTRTRVKPEPAQQVTPTPVPVVESVVVASAPARCIYGGEISGRYADGRCRGCGRRHEFT